MSTKTETIKTEIKNSKTAKTAASSMQEMIQNSQCCTPNTQVNEKSTVKINAPNKANPSKTTQHQEIDSNKNTPSKTRITVKYDSGFSNQLYIRGQGANLNWNKGQLLKNVKTDEWIWETNEQFTDCEFKILINDHIYENGDNHCLKEGCSIVYTPRF